jgi:uncharacterized membrane protein YfcA
MHEQILFAVLFLIGLCGSFFAGMLGLGGAIILVPMLLYLPPLFGLPPLDMKQISGMTIIVVFVSSLIALMVQHKNRFVSKRLVAVTGMTVLVSSFAGAVFSKSASSDSLLAVFACMAGFAAVIMFIPRKETGGDIPADQITFNIPLAVGIALVPGFIGGMVGAPGAYIFAPLIIYFLKIPTKVAIGSTLGIAFLASVSGAAGKLLTAQVLYSLTVALLLGAVPGARIGAMLTKKIPAAVLKKGLALVIAFAAIRMWLDVLG